MFEAFLVFFDPVLRFGAFFGAFAAVAAWEALAPRRALRWPRRRRWAGHLALLVLNIALVRLLLPAASVMVAAHVAARGWGLFGQLELPPWLAIAAAIVALDLAVYLQHVAAHSVPFLWRIHRVHHADPDFDATTGIRFHPAEAVLVVLARYAAIAVVGPPLAAVVLFELLLGVSTFFIHGNARLPASLDRPLRRLIVTPDMHRVHHSAWKPETNSNYGLWLSCWDRLFRTYRAQPRAGHTRLRIGLDDLGSGRSHLRFDTMLALPLREANSRSARPKPVRQASGGPGRRMPA